MEKRVKVAELKAQLSAYIREVRRGKPVTVCDRDTPVARLVPYRVKKEALESRKPTRDLKDIVLPSRPALPTNSLQVLQELRQTNR